MCKRGNSLVRGVARSFLRHPWRCSHAIHVEMRMTWPGRGDGQESRRRPSLFDRRSSRFNQQPSRTSVCLRFTLRCHLWSRTGDPLSHGPRGRGTVSQSDEVSSEVLGLSCLTSWARQAPLSVQICWMPPSSPGPRDALHGGVRSRFQRSRVARTPSGDRDYVKPSS
jgi:hypothetical protein